MACAVLLGAGSASAYNARVAWSPVDGASGYKVYVRQNLDPYGSGIDVGAPQPDADGVIRYLVLALPIDATNYFAVTSYDGSGQQSARSNELSIDYATVARLVDSDGDGLSDAQEDVNLNRMVDAGETDPRRADSDDDGLSDGAEVQIYRTNPLQVDTDGDGFPDGIEVAAGTDPNDPLSHPPGPPPLPTATPTPLPTSTPSGTVTPTPQATRTASPADACANPTLVPAQGGVFTGTTSGLSSQGGTCAATSNSPEQVFEWTPVVSGTATIATCGSGTTFDTVVYVRSGSCGSGTEVACNDDTAGCATGEPNDHHGSTIAPVVTAGQTYFIVVDGYDGRAGTFSLVVTEPVPVTPTATTTAPPSSTPSRAATPTPQATTTASPADACANPTLVPAQGGVFTGTTSGLSSQGGTCAATSNSPEQVFEWTPMVSGTATIATCGSGTTFDAVVYVRSGSCGSGTEVACNDDTAGCATGEPSDHHGSTIAPVVTAGQTYFIVVDGYDGRAGAFSLAVTEPVAATSQRTSALTLVPAAPPTAPQGICGNGRIEPGEQCDATDAAACPGLCMPDCTCPRYFELPLDGWSSIEGSGTWEVRAGDPEARGPVLVTETTLVPSSSFGIAYPSSPALGAPLPLLAVTVRDDDYFAIGVVITAAKGPARVLVYEAVDGPPRLQKNHAAFPLGSAVSNGRLTTVYRNLASDVREAFRTSLVHVEQIQLHGDLSASRIILADRLPASGSAATADSVQLPLAGWAQRGAGTVVGNEYDPVLGGPTLRAESAGSDPVTLRLDYPPARNVQLIAPFETLSLLIRNEAKFAVELKVRTSDGKIGKLRYESGRSTPRLERRSATLPLQLTPLPGNPYRLVTAELGADAPLLAPGVTLDRVLAVKLQGRFRIGNMVFSNPIR